jgi:hypothetical protein
MTKKTSGVSKVESKSALKTPPTPIEVFVKEYNKLTKKHGFEISVGTRFLPQEGGVQALGFALQVTAVVEAAAKTE